MTLMLMRPGRGVSLERVSRADIASLSFQPRHRHDGPLERATPPIGLLDFFRPISLRVARSSSGIIRAIALGGIWLARARAKQHPSLLASWRFRSN